MPPIFICITLLSMATGESQKQGGWKKELDKDGIVIHTRKVDDSPFHEFLAETTMPGNIGTFKKVFFNVENYTDWMPDCEKAEIIDASGENEFIYQMELKVPFPIADRYTVQRVKFVERPGKLTVTLENCDNCPDNEVAPVRIEEAYGTWIITQENQQEISVRFQYFADPGGDIPAWLVNTFIVKSPYQTLVNLRSMLENH